jgi:hypothetical protein
LRKTTSAVGLLFILIISGGSALCGQSLTGAIQGVVVDQAGHPIKGATVYLSSTAVLGVQIFLTGQGGGFDFPALAAGVYTVTAEKPDFKTLIRQRIQLPTGMSYFLKLILEASEEGAEGGEVVASGRAVPLHKISSLTEDIREQDFLRHLPLAREFSAVLNLAPAALSAGYQPHSQAAIQGGTIRDSAYLLDGVNLNDALSTAPLLNLDFDLIEEVGVIASGQPVSQPPAGGAYVNVISKSGGNSFAGEWAAYIINHQWNKDLWTTAQLEELGVGPPAGDKDLIESSLTLGGAFWENRAWYFLAGGYRLKSMVNNFVGPFQDILDRQHSGFNWTRQDISGFFKLTLRPMDKARGSIWINLNDVYQPVSEDPSPRLPFLSTHVLDHQSVLALYAVADYDLNQNILASLWGAYIQKNRPTLLQPDAENLPWTDDAGDLYGPLSGADYNSVANEQRVRANASLRIFAENILGLTHTFSLGANFDDSVSKIDWWRSDNLLWFMDHRNPNNYYYADRGLLAFWLCGTYQGASLFSGQSQQLGFYMTDSFSLAGRLRFNLSLRFDHAWGWFPAESKQISGNPLSLFLGEALLGPYLQAHPPGDLAANFNPWNQALFAEQKDFISWNALSPQASLAFDVRGDGKTLLTASYARYADSLSQRYFLPLHPLYPRSIPFYWLDTNGTGQPDDEDEYSLLALDYRFLSGSFSTRRVAEGIRAPFTEQFSIGLEHELFKDLTVGLYALSKEQKNILEDVLYDPDTGEYWYSLDQAAGREYWIPFTTTVPGHDSFPGQTVTFYLKSLQAPPAFLQLRNVPELKRKYRALEFVFHKRFSQGWQMAGSLVLGKSEGNIGGFAEDTTAFTAAANSPNDFINRYGPLNTDRPVQVKLQGTVQLPFGFWLSASFYHHSGQTWQRWAQILPPADWCLAHNVERTLTTVSLEAPGNRRQKAQTSLDVRLEKEWRLRGSGKMGFYIDIVNLLGFSDTLVGLNDVARWEPSAEGAGQPGLVVLQPDYGVTSAVYGRRTLRLGLRVDF